MIVGLLPKMFKLKLPLLVLLITLVTLSLKVKHVDAVTPLGENNVIILSDTAQVSAAGTKIPSAGNGTIGINGTTIRRVTNISGQNAAGGANGTTYRSYIEWDTTNLPKNINIQSIGLYFYATSGYGANNSVSITKLLNPVSSYPDTPVGNRVLYTDLATSSAYFVSSSDLSSAGSKILPIASISNPAAINELQSKIAKGLPFGVGIVGSNESSSYTSWLARQNTNYMDLHPALVIFYNGTIGQQIGMIRPLRNSFWDGRNYWQFFTATNGQYYSYSTDGSNWTLAGKLSSEANRHLGVWYDNTGNVWTAYSKLHSGLITNNNDLVLTRGTISGTNISWTQPTNIFTSSTNSSSPSGTIDGYDFPGIIKDSNNRCWAIARHYLRIISGSNISDTAGVEVKESLDTSCNSWGLPYSLSDVKLGIGSVHAHGGYIVPLTSGKIYAVFKDTDGTTGQIYGQLFDGNAWQPKVTIDPSTTVGVYIQGMSVVADGDTVHLIYIGSDGSLRYNFWNGQWNSLQILDNSSNFYTPALSLDTSCGKLYAFYRSTGNNNMVNASVYYKIGTPLSGLINWSDKIAVTNNSWTPQALMIGDAFWAMSSNYSAPGKIFATFVDGAYGLKSFVF